jgi:hypothetical protein
MPPPATPAKIEQVAAPPAPAASPAPIIIERVQPAAQQPILAQAQIQREASPPAVQVSIGTIDLRIAPPELPTRSRPPRRQARGFDAYHRRRDYGGWED